MAESLRKKTIRGVVWTFFERIGTQVVHFAITIILARLLMPTDYGVIGMLAVFLSVSQMFIDCGFGAAIIRKNDRTEDDFSTVFWYNLAVSIICYLTLFVFAPSIAIFYKMPVLTNVLRVIGLNLVIYAMYTIQVTRLTANVHFGLQARIAIASAVMSGIVGILLAYYGFGVWALVGQSMSAAISSCVMYWIFTGWYPQARFSVKSFRQLFGFGSKIMAASFLHTIYTNISPLIIGRKYSATDLGFYSRGDGVASLPGGIFKSTLGRVIYPVLSSIQDDDMRFRTAYCKYLRLITSLVSPTMLIIAACAKPIVAILLGEKWLPCVPYIQLLAIAWVTDPIDSVNLNVLYVKGRSDIVLKLEIIKKTIAILIVVSSIQFGVIWLCVGRVVYAYVALTLNTYFCGPFIKMSFTRQLKEVTPIYLSAFGAASVAFIIVRLTIILNAFPSGLFAWGFTTLMLSGSAGLCVYVVLAWYQKFDFVMEMMRVVPRMFGKKQ